MTRKKLKFDDSGLDRYRPKQVVAIWNWAKQKYEIDDDDKMMQRLDAESQLLRNRGSITAYQDAVSSYMYLNEYSADLSAVKFGTGRWKPSWWHIVFACLNIIKKCELFDSRSELHSSPTDFR